MNIFQYAANCEAAFKAMASDCGYTRKTTFYYDLSIAEVYGQKGIKDTFKSVMKEWMDNVEYITEFIMCLNWKSWQMAHQGNDEIGQLYAELYEKALGQVYKHYAKNEEACAYIYRTLD